jgi:hypothetical protein
MTDLKISQIRAINASISLGRILQETHPEIASLRREGMSLPTIVKKLDITGVYNVTAHIARNSVALSLCGHDGKLGIPAYAGSIRDPKERAKICRQNRIAPLVLPLEEKIALGRKIAGGMGYVTWLTEGELTIDEKDLAMALTHSPDYQISGQRVNNQAIADTLNAERELRGYDQVMTKSKVRTGLYKYRKQLERRKSS